MNLDTLTFQYPWRAYQARVLKNLDQYRQDRRIHIVAPPGAGKTVLGPEIVRRMNKPALILAPSLTIRAQWAQRFYDDFGADQAIVSHKLDQPAQVTIATYQAQFEYNKGQGIDGLDWAEVLVVDECHHIRNEWWKVLDAIVTANRLELVALTATPPYGVSGIEWRRYSQFYGEIDENLAIKSTIIAPAPAPKQPLLPQ